MNNNSARLRRHLAGCMLTAFMTEMVRNLEAAVTPANNVACRVVGENCLSNHHVIHHYHRFSNFPAFVVQCFTLAMISFMTVICVDFAASIITLR